MGESIQLPSTSSGLLPREHETLLNCLINDFLKMLNLFKKNLLLPLLRYYYLTKIMYKLSGFRCMNLNTDWSEICSLCS